MPETPPDPIFTEEELKEMKKAIIQAMAQGALTVRFRDHSVTYRSIEDMKQALAVIEQQLDPNTSKYKARTPRYDSGL